MKDGSLNALWNDHCKGASSDQNKKKFLKVFLETKGDLKKANAYLKELLKISEVQRGTIKCRRDPADPEEWQFSLVKSIAYHNTQHSHELQAETSGKMEVLDWIKARAAGAMMGSGEDAETAEAALNDVLPDKKRKREQLAIKDVEEEDDDEGHQEELAKAADEAEVLSDMGKNSSREHAAKRVQKMLKLLEKVKQEVGKGSQGSKASSMQKAMQKSLDDLTKLGKLRKRVTLEAAKDKLFDAAMAVKKARNQASKEVQP
eukprot:s2897_g11.t1